MKIPDSKYTIRLTGRLNRSAREGNRLIDIGNLLSNDLYSSLRNYSEPNRNLHREAQRSCRVYWNSLWLCIYSSKCKYFQITSESSRTVWRSIKSPVSASFMASKTDAGMSDSDSSALSKCARAHGLFTKRLGVLHDPRLVGRIAVDHNANARGFLVLRLRGVLVILGGC